jgi:branched-chain amino acid transport system substrate-binding protein
MRKSRWWLLLALVAALAAIASGCGGGDEEDAAPAGTDTGAAPAECAASIGIMGPFTGDVAAIGQEQLNWARFAVRKFNEENATNFKLVEGDTQLDPAQASTVAPQFVSNDDIIAVVGPAASQEVEAVGPIFERANMAFVSMSATRTDLTTEGKYPTFYRVVPNDDVQGPTDAEYMVDELGAKKVLIVDNRTSYSTGLSDTVQEVLEGGGVGVSREFATTKQTDFSAIVSKITDDTDVVFLPLQVAANAQIFANQMAEQGKDAVIFGSDGLFSPEDFKAEGAYVSAFAPDIRGLPEKKQLVDEFTTEFGDFGTFGPPTFAATDVVMRAIFSVCQSGEEPNRDAVVEAVEATELSDSILGQPISFDENGDIENARFFIFQIKEGGTYELVE